MNPNPPGWAAYMAELDRHAGMLEAERAALIAAGRALASAAWNRGADEMTEQAIEEARELAADAARYRWLRAQHWNAAPLCVVADPKHAVKLGHDCPALARLDWMIDAAMGCAASRSDWHPCRDVDGATCADLAECANGCMRRKLAWPDTRAPRADGVTAAPAPSNVEAQRDVDARRWRWLMGQHFTQNPIAQVVWMRNSKPNGQWVNVIDGKDLAAHVDAALGVGAVDHQTKAPAAADASNRGQPE